MTLEAARGEHETLVIARGRTVLLRRKRRADAIDEFAWRRDPETSRLNGQSPPPNSFARFLELFEQELLFDGRGREQLAIDTLAGEHIGTVMYYRGEDGVSCELGITIGPPAHRGRGAGREAVVHFLRHVFDSHPYREVYLHTLESNLPARRAFLAAGFNPTVTVLRGSDRYVRMEARREWWLLWDMEGRFAFADSPRAPGPGS
ncbi:GNAT family N-acetyltransferase [Tepidiforma sp.]|uniref:GNAT family N-acetyltransferase n=1 Tax=Tepidiforma sp. TaxID=2682230 RepID=UPI002ADD7789|nr:GNAT family N-acetyltransferase [Tepidiforma sp.]